MKGNCCGFELGVPCVYLFHCMVATKFELQLVQSTDVVHRLNVKHELRSKGEKQFCQLFYMIKTFPNDISWFVTRRSCFTFSMD